MNDQTVTLDLSLRRCHRVVRVRGGEGSHPLYRGQVWGATRLVGLSMRAALWAPFFGLLQGHLSHCVVMICTGHTPAHVPVCYWWAKTL